jgi:hypothetical protein
MSIQYKLYVNDKIVHFTKRQVEARRVAEARLKMLKREETLRFVASFQGTEKVLLNVVQA